MTERGRGLARTRYERVLSGNFVPRIEPPKNGPVLLTDDFSTQSPI